MKNPGIRLNRTSSISEGLNEIPIRSPVTELSHDRVRVIQIDVSITQIWVIETSIQSRAIQGIVININDSIASQKHNNERRGTTTEKK